MNRKQLEPILEDLKKKLVFIVGPRQVGKTWLAKELGKEFLHPLYLNYDDAGHREIIKKQAWLPETDLLILDEIQKMKAWKNALKGIFDTKLPHLKILVTGSARLDAHRSAGDSLAGRYFVHHLLPLSFKELAGTSYELSHLFNRGGFPEPFLSESEVDAGRWHGLYAESLLRQDVLDFENVGNRVAMQQVFDLLRHRVGSPLSYSALARDVGISPITVKRYIQIFEALYIVFTLKPYTHKISRSILKEPKLYFYNTAFVEDPGTRFENMIALELLTSIKWKEDQTGLRRSLCFLRNKEGKEVDFAISNERGELEHLIEAKLSDDHLSPSLAYFSKKYGVPGTQVLRQVRVDRLLTANIQLKQADSFLLDL